MRRGLALLGCLLLLLVVAGWGLDLASETSPIPATVTRAEAVRSTGRLVFWSGDRVVAELPARFGINPAPKEREGDRATPIGSYTLLPGRPSRWWRSFLPISYPNEEDRAAGRTGSAIGLHGTGWLPILPLVHRLGFNWTAGCIAVTNPQVDAIGAAIVSPVPLTIRS